MTRFIVLDNDIEELNTIIKIIKEVDREGIIKTFKKVDRSFLKEISNTDMPKIYILDIELDSDISGINAARLIRKNDYNSEIIFITNHDKMFESAHRSVYETFDFIEKFHNFKSRLKKDLTIIINHKRSPKYFKFQTNNVELNICYDRILYIYRDTAERKAVIVTNNNEYKINLKLNEMDKYLDSRFKKCHRSCIVNSEHIEFKDYKKGYFKLDNGKEIYMLSKKYKIETA